MSPVSQNGLFQTHFDSGAVGWYMYHYQATVLKIAVILLVPHKALQPNLSYT